MSKRISVDYENNAEIWWDAAREDQAHHAIPPTIASLVKPLLEVGGVDSITVSDAEAARIVLWAKSLPGWSDGPDHAPTALTVSDE